VTGTCKLEKTHVKVEAVDVKYEKSEVKIENVDIKVEKADVKIETTALVKTEPKNENEEQVLKIMSWNVNGIRAWLDVRIALTSLV
jgi:hypothetical protein